MPRFIALEGPDGAGTTLHSKLLAEKLEQSGESTLLTAEPTDGPIGSMIRTMLRSHEGIPGDALQLLFTADRAWHMKEIVEPALKEGKTVITDRCSPSTILYGSAMGLDSEWLQLINKPFQEPDTLILTLPPFEVCQERLLRRPHNDALEASAFQRKVYDQYRAFADMHPHIPVVDTSGDKQQVADQIFQLL